MKLQQFCAIMTRNLTILSDTQQSHLLGEPCKNARVSAPVKSNKMLKIWFDLIEMAQEQTYQIALFSVGPNVIL